MSPKRYIAPRANRYIDYHRKPLEGGVTYFVPSEFIGVGDLKGGIRMDPSPLETEEGWEGRLLSNGEKFRVTIIQARKLRRIE